MFQFYKKMKITTLLFLTGILLITQACAQEKPVEKPIDVFFEEAFGSIVTLNPERLAAGQLYEKYDAEHLKGSLETITPEARETYYNTLRTIHSDLMQYSDSSLSEENRLSKQIFLWWLEDELAREKFQDYQYTINQLVGVQATFPRLMLTSHPINSIQDAEFYIERLQKVRPKFDQAIQDMHRKEDMGIILPTIIAERSLEQVTRFLSADAADNSLLQDFKQKLSQLDNLDSNKAEELTKRAEEAIRNYTIPAYEAVAAYLVDVKERSSEEVGALKHPNGDEYYKAVLKQYTTTDLTAEEIHQIGLREVARLQEELVRMASSIGIEAEGGFSAVQPLVFQHISQNPDLGYPDSDASRELILQDYRNILAEFESEIDTAFNILPESALEVRRIPEANESTSPGAYYTPPTQDGETPGIFWVNLANPGRVRKPGMRALALHEGIPGHHFQLAIVTELENVPTFRNFITFTAYVEGWGLYAEQVGDEMGLLPTPYDKIGQIGSEMFRAARLVLDTGIHAKGWSREEALNYMQQNLGYANPNEIDRYIAFPGQATSYQIGKLEIIRLRQMTEEALGNNFDIATFHDIVLGNGAVPLEILENFVSSYIERQ